MVGPVSDLSDLSDLGHGNTETGKVRICREAVPQQ